MIHTREFTDQVFDAATSVQVWTTRKSCRRILLLQSPGLVAGLIGIGWSLGGKGLKWLLKDGNTLTNPQNTVKWGVWEVIEVGITEGWSI